MSKKVPATKRTKKPVPADDLESDGKKQPASFADIEATIAEIKEG